MKSVSFASYNIPAEKICLLNYDVSSEAMGNYLASFSRNSFRFLNYPSFNFNVLADKIDFAAFSVFDGIYAGAVSFLFPTSI
ncbi:MAG: hypothetical protein LBT07_01235 [Endomicrobium sp.]|nr:hypothetical protein [Endomicrobium sp.]